MLAHAKAVTAYRELALAGEIGVVLNLTPSYTLTDSDADKKAAGYADLFFNRSFLDPLVKHEFPKAPVSYTHLDVYKRQNIFVAERIL